MSESGSVAITVLGPRPVADLGVTHLHEHLLSDFRCYLPIEQSARDRSRIGLATYQHHRLNAATEHNLTLDDVDEAVVEVTAFQAAGGHTVVDSTSIGIGRDPAGLADIASATGANIIMGSGRYVHSSLADGFRRQGGR